MRPATVFRLTAAALLFSCTLLLQRSWGQGLDVYQIPLIPELDTIGDQILAIQAYRDTDGDRLMAGIYDTGASVITVSWEDQDAFSSGVFGVSQPIPILNYGGAVGQAIGGTIVGDVSQPGTILADGIHAFGFNLDTFEMDFDFTQAQAVEQVQTFVGTQTGSPDLPTIIGTPIHNPSPMFPQGATAWINMQDYGWDLGDDLIIPMPDLQFKEPTFSLTPTAATTSVFRIPLELWGEDNHGSEGDAVTDGYNPIAPNVALHQGTQQAENMKFLFDTGAQMSIISPEIAEQLDLDLENPTWTIDVQGAADEPIKSLPGYAIEVLELPRDDDGDGTIDGLVQFNDAPVFVLDLGVPGLDGILGMNLWNTASDLLYNPTDPGNASLSVTFFTDPDRSIPEEWLEWLQTLSMLSDQGVDLGVFAGFVHNPPLSPTVFDQPVPEPSTWLLIITAGAALGLAVRRRSARTLQGT
ncbi:MAG: aspartyl protease family protein [Pirellulales bacterium]|nr:aspartyl protease family protein [Pirellulales bacterium]